uniref:Immunoglobulin V-set domain-containing protein n=1 Tax=Neovison vison TaxID=452646 RepID=A0A8C7A6T9_NEOVI
TKFQALLPPETPSVRATSLLPAPAGRSAECVTNTNYGIKQPDRLSAPQGGSVRIPFSFYQEWELAKDPRVSVALRRTHFHGESIYNSTRRFIHKDYKNRISLELSEGQRSGSLQISNLQEKDGNMYFCRIQVETSRCGKKVWQAINGTKLTITPDQLDRFTSEAHTKTFPHPSPQNLGLLPYMVTDVTQLSQKRRQCGHRAETQGCSLEAGRSREQSLP